MKTTLCFTLTLLTFITLTSIPNSFLQDDSPEYVVRVTCFVPNDPELDPNMDEKLDELIKDAQMFYATRWNVTGLVKKHLGLKRMMVEML